MLVQLVKTQWNRRQGQICVIHSHDNVWGSSENGTTTWSYAGTPFKRWRLGLFYTCVKSCRSCVQNRPSQNSAKHHEILWPQNPYTQDAIHAQRVAIVLCIRPIHISANKILRGLHCQSYFGIVQRWARDPTDMPAQSAIAGVLLRVCRHDRGVPTSISKLELKNNVTVELLPPARVVNADTWRSLKYDLLLSCLNQTALLIVLLKVIFCCCYKRASL